MELDLYRIVANTHMADALMVYVPRDKLLVQGDLFDVSWEVYWWGSSYADNVRHRNLQVDRDVPVHGRISPFAEVQQQIDRRSTWRANSARPMCCAGRTPEVLATNDLGERFLASPAIAQGRIFLRSDGTLFAVGATATR